MEELTREYVSQVMYYVKEDVLEVVAEVMKYVPYSIIMILMVMVIFRNKRAVGVFLFMQYIVIIGYITLLSREPGSREGIDFTVFATLGVWSRMDAFVVENILLFIPIGMLLPFTWKRFQNVWWSFLAGGVLSAMIEGIQYVTKRGFVQLEDIVTNVMGTLIGFLLFSVIKLVYILVVRYISNKM